MSPSRVPVAARRAIKAEAMEVVAWLTAVAGIPLKTVAAELEVDESRVSRWQNAAEEDDFPGRKNLEKLRVFFRHTRAAVAFHPNWRRLDLWRYDCSRGDPTRDPVDERHAMEALQQAFTSLQYKRNAEPPHGHSIAVLYGTPADGADAHIFRSATPDATLYLILLRADLDPTRLRAALGTEFSHLLDDIVSPRPSAPSTMSFLQRQRGVASADSTPKPDAKGKV